MNSVYFLIVAAIVAGATGSFLQAIGTAKQASESARVTKYRRTWLALGTFLTALAIYFLWSGQQHLSQQAAAKPIVDIFIDPQKILHLQNFGTVDIEDVRIDATVYALKGNVADGHLTITGIESFSKISTPIWSPGVIPKTSGDVQYPLASIVLARLLPFSEDIPNPDSPVLRTVYCFRVLARNAVTKQRIVRYVMTQPLKGFPDLYGDYRNAAIGSPYDASNRLFEIRNKIRAHQANLFDDDPATIYRD